MFVVLLGTVPTSHLQLAWPHSAIQIQCSTNRTLAIGDTSCLSVSPYVPLSSDSAPVRHPSPRLTPAIPCTVPAMRNPAWLATRVTSPPVRWCERSGFNKTCGARTATLRQTEDPPQGMANLRLSCAWLPDQKRQLSRNSGDRGTRPRPWHRRTVDDSTTGQPGLPPKAQQPSNPPPAHTAPSVRSQRNTWPPLPVGHCCTPSR